MPAPKSQIRPAATDTGNTAVIEQLKLEIEDLRFERDRFRASSAQYQNKLIEVLDEMETLRMAGSEAVALKRELVSIVKEFRRKEEALSGQMEVQAATLHEAHRREIVALSVEFARAVRTAGAVTA